VTAHGRSSGGTPGEGGGAAPFRLGSRPPLSGIRTLAIVPVLAFHAGMSRAQGGYLGVDVFFVLSGFLITALLAEEQAATGGIRLRDFYARRGLRLLPALFLLLFACAIYASIYPHQVENQTFWRDFVGTIFYSANWVAAAHKPEIRLLSHTWSLAIEEQFYLFWPLILTVLLRRHVRRGAVLAVVVAGIAGSFAMRVWLLPTHGPPSTRLFNGLDTRGGALLTGCLLGLLVGWDLLPRAAWFRRLATVLSVLSFAYLVWMFVGARYTAVVIYHHPSRLYVEGLTVLAVAVALVILGVMVNPHGALAWLLSLRPVVWIGRVSYGLYLWHYPIDRALRPGNLTFGLGSRSLQALRLSLTFAVVTASFYLLEQPILRLKGRFTFRERAAADRASQLGEDG
jgi:peptidoglycan/LPS O-acetylase OafA/YrhL